MVMAHTHENYQGQMSVAWFKNYYYYYYYYYAGLYLQCFDAVGWAAGRASGL